MTIRRYEVWLQLWECVGFVVVVEQVDQSASLYSCSTQGHHICLLVKHQVSNTTPTVDTPTVKVESLAVEIFNIFAKGA